MPSPFFSEKYQNPHAKILLLCFLPEGLAPRVPWLTAVANNRIDNDLYDQTGSDEGKTLAVRICLKNRDCRVAPLLAMTAVGPFYETTMSK